jgi:predicted  nucleic acid-binding Zn-ribbon protein
MPATQRGVSSKKNEDDVPSSSSSKKTVEQPVLLRPGVNIVKRIQELEEIVKSLEIELQQIEKKRADGTDQQGSSPNNADVDQLIKRRSEIQKEIKAHGKISFC